MQASWGRLINQGFIGQLWPHRPQSVEHILLLPGLLTRTNRRGEGQGGWGGRSVKKESSRTEVTEKEGVKDWRMESGV